MIFVSSCQQQNTKAETLRWRYSEFAEAVENNRVKQVIMESDTTDTLDTRSVKAKVITSNHQEIKVWFPTGDRNIEFLIDKKVLFSFTPLIDSNTFNLADLVSRFEKDNQGSLTEITFTEFIQAVENSKVESITIKNNGFDGRARFTNGTEFIVYLPIDSSYLYKTLSKNNIAINTKSQNISIQSNLAEWTYTQFIQGIESNQVDHVNLDYRVTKAKITTSDNKQVEVLIPRNVSYILNLLTAKDISISFEYPKKNPTTNIGKIVAESLQQDLSKIPEVTFSEFVQAVENRKVKLFWLPRNGGEGRTKLFDDSEFKVIFPYDLNYAVDILVENNVPISRISDN